MTAPPSTGHSNPAVPIKTIQCGSYKYLVTPSDLQLEQQAFKPGEGVGTFESLHHVLHTQTYSMLLLDL